MRPEILFLDLDGTLLSDEKTISESDQDVLWEFSNAGIKVGYITSRTNRKIKSLITGLPCDFIASINGSEIRILKEGWVIWEEKDGIPWNDGLQLLFALKDWQFGTVGANFAPYSLFEDIIYAWSKPVGPFLDVIDWIQPSRFQRIRIYNAKNLQQIDISDQMRIMHEGNDVLIESVTADKGRAVEKILEYYGIPKEKAIAFGDEEGDISMFRACGYSVAMDNATPAAKAEADAVADDNNHSGVSRWLRENCDLEEKTHLHGTLGDDNCIYLLKDLKGLKTPASPAEKREKLQKGIPGHLVLAEDPPVSAEENQLFMDLVEDNKKEIAKYVGILSESIYAHKGELPVLVSLARGGIAYGALCRRYFRKYYHADVPHYAISIVRNSGIDENALDYIVNKHGDIPIQFVDGWTGSGFIGRQLKKYIALYNQKHSTQIDSTLAVLADTSHISQISGTREDILLPDCCLNATVCGLMSGIYAGEDVIGKEDFHGAVLFEQLQGTDFSRYYLESISSSLQKQECKTECVFDEYGKKMSEKLSVELGISDKKKIRLGIGESTRAVFRSRISMILVKQPDDPKLKYLRRLSVDKNILIKEHDTGLYSCVAIIDDTNGD